MMTFLQSIITMTRRPLPREVIDKLIGERSGAIGVSDILIISGCVVVVIVLVFISL